MLAKRSENYFPSIFDRFFNNDLMDWNLSNFSSTNTSLPAVNVKENDNEFSIEVAAPGLTKKDFNIHFHNNVLTISSEKKNERKKRKKIIPDANFHTSRFSVRLP